METTLVLIMLHAPHGHVIYLNPDSVTTLRAAAGEKNKLLIDDVKCLLNTLDGKFISVIETCETVLRLIERKE